PGGGAEVDAELAADDLGERRLAEAGRAYEEDVIQRLLAPARGVDEHLEIGAGLRLPDELGQHLRAQRSVRRIVGAGLGRHHAGGFGHAQRASSRRPRRISSSAVAASPAARWAVATAALACTWA